MANSTLPNTPSDNASPPLIVAILELKLPKHNPSMKNMLDIARFFSFIIDIMDAPLIRLAACSGEGIDTGQRRRKRPQTLRLFRIDRVFLHADQRLTVVCGDTGNIAILTVKSSQTLQLR